MNDSKPDYRKASSKAAEILLLSNEIKVFPFKVTDVVNEFFDIKFKSYAEMAKRGIPKSFWLSDDAEFIEFKGRNIIFYNQDIRDVHRMRFSVLHEVGHYYMQHNLSELRKLKERNIEKFKTVYSTYEREADFFAASLLIPDAIIKELIKRGYQITLDFLVRSFNVSYKAAEVKMNIFRKFNSYGLFDIDDNFESYILQKYINFVNSIAPQKRIKDCSMEREYELQAERDSWY